MIRSAAMDETLNVNTFDVGLILIVALIAFVVEMGLFVAWSYSLLTAAQAVGVHIVLSVSLVLLWYLMRRKGRDQRLPGVLAASTATLGGFGAIGTIVSSITLLLVKESAMISWRASVSEHGKTTGRIGNAHLDSGVLKARIHSLGAKMRHGTYAEKMRLIAALSRSPRAELTPFLREALKDEDAAVRVQAATVIEKMEHRFTLQWMGLQQQTKEQSNNVEVWMELANLCDRYAYLGVAEPGRVAELRKQAMVAYQRCWEVQPERLVIRRLLGRCLVRSGAYDRAARLIESGKGEFESPDEALWYCEALYGQKRFDVLRRILHKHISLTWVETLPTYVRNAVAMWKDLGKPA